MLQPRSLACKAILAVALVTATCMCVLPARAADVTVWRPTTAAGGAPVDPGLWVQLAAVPVSGFGAISPVNVTLAPSTTNVKSTTTNYDYSTTPTTVNGGQTNVNTSAQVGTGTVTVTANHP